LFDQLVLLPELEFDRVRVALHSARADGVELLITAQPNGAWSGWLSYAWSKVTDRVARDLANVVADTHNVPRSWDQRHAANVGIAWTQGQWSATLTETFHSGWPTTNLVPANGLIAQGERNASRFPYYNSVDVRLAHTFKLRHGGGLEAFIEVANLGNRSNRCCTQYSASRSPNGVVVLNAEPQDWLPRVPSLGVEWRY
jgi:hypothetical protein